LKDSLRYSYDALNRLTGVSGARSQTSYRYDAVGNRVGVTETKGGRARATSATFDAADQLLKLAGPDGRETTFAYDGEGQQVEQREGSKVTRQEWSDAGRLAAVLSHSGKTTRYRYDGDGRLHEEARAWRG